MHASGWKTLTALCLAIALVMTLSVAAFATLIPLRSGTVVSRVDAGAVSYIKAMDGKEQTFWVVTSICTVGEGGKIEVLAGAHYEKLRNDSIDQTFEDVYTAQLIRINGQDVKGFGAHGLPEGCIVAD